MMAERMKMNRVDRAKQFAPFDALKGLQDSLRMKEFEHERLQMGDLTEEKVVQISNTLLSLKKGDMVEATFFENGDTYNWTGNATLDYESHTIYVGQKDINFFNLLDIKKKN